MRRKNAFGKIFKNEEEKMQGLKKVREKRELPLKFKDELRKGEGVGYVKIIFAKYTISNADFFHDRPLDPSKISLKFFTECASFKHLLFYLKSLYTYKNLSSNIFIH